MDLEMHVLYIGWSNIIARVFWWSGNTFDKNPQESINNRESERGRMKLMNFNTRLSENLLNDDLKGFDPYISH